MLRVCRSNIYSFMVYMYIVLFFFCLYYFLQNSWRLLTVGKAMDGVNVFLFSVRVVE